MYQIDFNKAIHVHFIGIGGISMSGLAEILLQRGFTITGSDAGRSPLTDHLESLGARIAIGQAAGNITGDIDVVVYTAAIHPDNPEFRAAADAGIPMMTRAELLGQIMKNYELPVAVAGTHGKTTTTSMAASILLAADKDPTITVGGIMPQIGSNIRVGRSGHFIAEACEYTNSFLSFFPKVAIILNVDADHLDFFKDLDDIADSFHRFAALLPEDGTLIINRDTARFDTVTAGLSCRVITFSLTDDRADYCAAGISYDEAGCAAFTCLKQGRDAGRYQLSVPGLHNVGNALASIAMAELFGIDREPIARGLLAFHGTDRRFQKKGTLDGVTIIDDYAHHPTEIAATLKAAARYPHRELYVAFQPHTYTRTQALLPAFADVLAGADHVLLSDIYAAREVNTIGITSDDLRRAIAERGGDALYFDNFEDLEAHIRTHCVDGDMLITMGAGDIFKVGEDLLKGEK